MLLIREVMNDSGLVMGWGIGAGRMARYITRRANNEYSNTADKEKIE